MKYRILAIAGILSLCWVLVVGSLKSSWAIQKMADFRAGFGMPSTLLAQTQWYTPPGIPVVGCQTRPKWNPPQPNIETTFQKGSLTIARFRQTALSPGVNALPERSANNRVGDRNYTPREEITLANPTNFGERYYQDVNGQPVNNDPIIVIHETVIPAWQTVRFFQTYHPRDSDQASYHTLIKQDGTIFYLVPPDKRAFGAGNSVFNGESVKTNRLYASSVNNFAYHIAFETPPDGRNNGNVHSGYTDLQYESLAWLISKTGVPDSRISYHKAVDRSGSRKDPRSFNTQKFQQLLSLYPKSQEIVIGCPAPFAQPSAQPSLNPSF